MRKKKLNGTEGKGRSPQRREARAFVLLQSIDLSDTYSCKAFFEAEEDRTEKRKHSFVEADEI